MTLSGLRPSTSSSVASSEGTASQGQEEDHSDDGSSLDEREIVHEEELLENTAEIPLEPENDTDVDHVLQEPIEPVAREAITNVSPASPPSPVPEQPSETIPTPALEAEDVKVEVLKSEDDPVHVVSAEGTIHSTDAAQSQIPLEESPLLPEPDNGETGVLEQFEHEEESILTPPPPMSEGNTSKHGVQDLETPPLVATRGEAYSNHEPQDQQLETVSMSAIEADEQPAIKGPDTKVPDDKSTAQNEHVEQVSTLERAQQALHDPEENP